MKLWLISQDQNNDYDTFSDAVVLAKTADDARMIHPGLLCGKDYGLPPESWGDQYSSWVLPKDVEVQYLGNLSKDYLFNPEKPVICASFHAG